MNEFTSHDKRIKIYNKDCMEVMKSYPNNYFDIAIVDPPYGIGIISKGVILASVKRFKEQASQVKLF